MKGMLSLESRQEMVETRIGMSVVRKSQSLLVFKVEPMALTGGLSEM